MTTKLPPVDVVIVGMGWTGGILARELGPTGLKIVALERGPPRSAQNDFALPHIRDELRFARRNELMMDPSIETFTARNNRRKPRCRCGSSARSHPDRVSAAPARIGTASAGAGRITR